MSVETDQTQQPAAPVAGAAPATPPPPAPEAEVPAIRVGNSGAHIARASQEIERQFRAAESGQQPGSSAEPESADVTSGATVGGQPATPTQTQPPDELTTLRQRLDEFERKQNEDTEKTRAAELQNLNARQKADYEELVSDAEKARLKAVKEQTRLDNLLTEYQNAMAEQDYDTVQAITVAYNEQLEDVATSQRTAQRLKQQQDQFKAYADNQYHESLMREQAAQIGKIAAKYGLTPDDVKAVNPKLNITNPFDVQETMLAALHKKLTTDQSEKNKAANDQATKIRQEILNEFDNSPGAQPHPGGSTNTATGAQVGIRVGNSGAMIRRAFENQR
jgi:hypothetical protein